MFGVDDLILGGLAAGGSLLSGIGSSKAAKSQNKRAAAQQQVTNWENQNIQQRTNDANQALQAAKNAVDAGLGRGLVDRSDAMANVDLAAFVKARDASGYNPVTFLNSGALSLFDNRSAKQALLAQGTALQSPGMTTIGQVFDGTAPTVSVPSMFSAVGGAISAGTGALGSSYQNNQRVDAANQSSMLQYLASIQYARKSGNALAGLGTPSLETTSGSSVAAVAAKLAKGDGLNSYGFKVEPPSINAGNVDPSIMNPQGGRGFLGGLTDGIYASTSDWYWKAFGRNMGADATIATDNWFSGPGSKRAGAIDESIARGAISQMPYAKPGTEFSPADVWRSIDSNVFGPVWGWMSPNPAY